MHGYLHIAVRLRCAQVAFFITVIKGTVQRHTHVGHYIISSVWPTAVVLNGAPSEKSGGPQKQCPSVNR